MAFERIEPDTPEWVSYFANHIQRYEFAAAELLRRGARHVLDVATGVGYGAHCLASRGIPRVTAADRNERALGIARNRFAHPAITFVADECSTLANSASIGPFDAIVSFETLEHLDRPEEFLARCRATLVPRGTLIISTPNRHVSSPGGRIDWEFHVHEFTATEFTAVLANAGFSNVTLHAQRMTEIGRLRADLRSEINILRSNPVVRAGRWVQRVLRAAPTLSPALPERLEDMEIVPLASATECESLDVRGPFVLIAVAVA